MTVANLFLLFYAGEGFSAIPRCGTHIAGIHNHQSRSQTLLHVANLRDADFGEMLVGGQRYEMVPLPDSMVETTLFVGNLCEFIKDEDLDRLFRTVSSLKSVPACVSRKPNWDSLQYGFVTFPNVEEKEKALIKFHGYELNGRRLKVECIRDTPGINRVRVPEKMVLYMCGEAKKTSDGRVNTMRRVSRAEVDRMSKGQGPKNNNKKVSKSDIPLRLRETEQAELGRAERKGYVSLLSTAYRRGRKSSALANVHRQWCDAREKPQIILCKASGGRPLDHVIVDLSPLRIHGILDDPRAADEFLVKWKTQILLAAEQSGMIFRDDYVEDNTVPLDDVDEDDIDVPTELVITMDTKSWATLPIEKLPVVSLGVFEGERSKAKAMAKELAELWDIPERAQDENIDEISSNSNHNDKPRKNKSRGKSSNDHRRRDRDRNKWL